MQCIQLTCVCVCVCVCVRVLAISLYLVNSDSNVIMIIKMYKHESLNAECVDKRIL